MHAYIKRLHSLARYHACMSRGKRLTRNEQRAVTSIAGARAIEVYQGATRMQRGDMIRVRRALIAGLLVRRKDIAEIMLHVALPLEAGGLGYSISESTVVKDIAEIRKSWEADAKRRIRTGLTDELAKLEYLERYCMPSDESAFDPQRLAGALAITDRKVKLLGLDLETRSKLALANDGPIGNSDIRTLLERARAARTRMQDDNVVDVQASE